MPLSIPVPDAFVLLFHFSFFILIALSVMMMDWRHLMTFTVAHNGSLCSVDELKTNLFSAALDGFARETKK